MGLVDIKVQDFQDRFAIKINLALQQYREECVEVFNDGSIIDYLNSIKLDRRVLAKKKVESVNRAFLNHPTFSMLPEEFRLFFAQRIQSRFQES